MTKKIWGGRFKNITNKKVEKFSSSLDIDKNLYAFDIQGSIAHVEMLSKQKIISVSDKRKIVKSLNQIHKQIEKGRFEFAVELEDIHMNIEQAVTKRIGNSGKKVHTARSRNDQVVTDVKLYIKDIVGNLRKDLVALEKNIVKNAEKNLS
jgi:argininosuccinate lyase